MTTASTRRPRKPRTKAAPVTVKNVPPVPVKQPETARSTKALSLAAQAKEIAARVDAANGRSVVSDVKPAAPTGHLNDLEKSIYKMNLEYVQCRDFGHSWRPYTAQSVPGGFKSVLRCGRCTTIRVRMLGPSGQLLDSGYDYADGYLMEPGHGRLSSEDRDVIRLASVRSVLVVDTVDQ